MLRRGDTTYDLYKIKRRLPTCTVVSPLLLLFMTIIKVLRAYLAILTKFFCRSLALSARQARTRTRTHRRTDASLAT
jgi:hypothetical protein